MNNKILLVLSLAFFFTCSSKKDLSKSEKPSESYSILFYNVENLFDTIDTEGVKDEEYTPGSEKEWNSERYDHKLTQLSKVIAYADSLNLPDIIGICEIENIEVLKDLSNTDLLKDGKYQIIHQDSPDKRGIDVALLHNDNYRSLYNEQIHVDLQGDRPDTRNILYSKGILDKDTIHLFVNHWPSRYGGKEKSDPKRAIAASRLKHKVDSISSVNSMAKIIIMGDFNDYPADPSLVEILDARPEMDGEDFQLVNLAYKDHINERGSYNYRGEWGCLDQFIVSSPLMEGQVLWVDQASFQIIKKPWMMYVNDKGVAYPSRTYGGKNYYGGYSDHLPILLKINKRN